MSEKMDQVLDARGAVRGGYRLWTAEEDAKLEAGYQAGLTMKHLAERLPGRSPDACRERCARLGLHRTKHRPRALLTGGPDADDRRLFAQFVSQLPPMGGSARDLLDGLRDCGNWRSVAREWIENARHRVR